MWKVESVFLLPPQVQEKLYLEISEADQEVTETGEMEMSYETTANLRYLDMVVLETMRHFPTCDAMRTCTKDYKGGHSI